MPIIICHPDNWNAVKAKLDLGQFDKPGLMCAEFQIRTNPQVDRYKATGRYTLPDGATVDKSSIRIKSRFVEYGPEDTDWLLYAGIIREEREMVFFVMDDPIVCVRHDFMPKVSRLITHTPA